MNFIESEGIGWALEKYVATPKGEEAVKKYLTSPEGIVMLQNFVGTPEGKNILLSILPQILSGLNLPPEVTASIRSAIERRQ